MRIDPDPNGAAFGMLSQYLDYQRETLLSKTDGLTRAQLTQKHPPSELILAGLLYHLVTGGRGLDGGSLCWPS